MDVKKYIYTNDHIISKRPLARLKLWLDDHPKLFEQGTIVGAEKENLEQVKQIRNTQTLILSNAHNSYTARHWFSWLSAQFAMGAREYGKNYQFTSYPDQRITDIQILKYEQTGHYKFHVDHCSTIPRTLSMILQLNEGFEGGELCFSNPDGSDPFQLSTKEGRLIVWPSLFLYPHMVTPITKGIRYSIICWTL